ncbi:hypothetical protein [Pontibacter burrus]|uniref:Uncharacterized protein n=1 Tax=Pontibacter burrus TaxID=2704466 RepID=A0A6B3LUX4_9BACT|nr:hypothetical protein [Pontibacter burrus]NEM98795.1 hypothetical protein [Pontibacter burrus]
MNKAKEKSEQSKTWENAIVVTYFIVLYYGLRLALENFLFEDTLPLALTMLLGFISAILTTLVALIVKGKELKVKAIGVVVLLILMVITNLLVA